MFSNILHQSTCKKQKKVKHVFSFLETQRKINAELKSLSLHEYKLLIKNLIPVREEQMNTLMMMMMMNEVCGYVSL